MTLKGMINSKKETKDVKQKAIDEVKKNNNDSAVIRCSSELHKQIKIESAKQSMALRDFVDEILSDYLNNLKNK